MSVKSISPTDLYQHMKLGHNVVLIDVRPVEEYDRCHIKGAISYPLETFHAQALIHRVLARFPEPPTIYLTCASGKDSPIASQHLLSASYDYVRVLQGGTKAWVDQNLPIVKKHTKPPLLTLQQQTEVFMGGVVTIGVLMGAYVYPIFYFIPFAAGLGYMFEAVFKTNYLKKFLMKASWNRDI